MTNHAPPAPGSSQGNAHGSAAGTATHPGADTPVELTVHGHDLLFPSLPYDLSQRAGRATQDEHLQRFVNNAALYRDRNRRSNCPDAFGANYNALRQLAGSIKQHTLDHLDYYLEQFIGNATAAGAQVHFAATAADANAICCAIAKQHGSKLCVKSKSMVTEEIQLLPELEGLGVEVVETDLGEFIVQIDDDAPSHIVQPIIHKDRTAVARAFTRELGAPYTEDPAELTRIAREHLREKYRQADLGISGGNFLVADSGSVVICTNEGNGRLCTSVPKVHVAFVGIEKMVPALDHLGVLLKLLARSATSQPLTCYTHFMTGPRRANEPDGPEEMHIILVDNGRSEILKPETREMLRCIRCGACLNACPVYRKIGGHSYGAVYSGPIGALITPMFRGLANYKDLPYASSLCGACYEACPVHINIPKYLIQLRSELIGGRHDKWFDRLFFRVWSIMLREKWTYQLGGKLSSIFLRLLGKARKDDPYSTRGYVSKMPGPVAGWTSQRDLPTPPAQGFRQWWDQHQSEREKA